MLVKKLNVAAMVFLTVSAVGLGPTFLSHRTLAAEPGLSTTITPRSEPANFTPLSHVIDDVSRLPPEAARMYAYVSTPLTPAELAYRRIPWLLDLNEGLRVARDEKRPLLVWTSGDDPLDRC